MHEYSDRQIVDILGQVINSHKQLDSIAVAFRDELHGIADPFIGGTQLRNITVQVMEEAPGITFHHAKLDVWLRLYYIRTRDSIDLYDK